MNALRPRAPFGALIVSEVSRLVREQLDRTVIWAPAQPSGPTVHVKVKQNIHNTSNCAIHVERLTDEEIVTFKRLLEKVGVDAPP